MTIAFRHYQPLEDYQRVADFLIQHSQPGNQDGIGSNQPGNTCQGRMPWIDHP
ncbi:MAG: hypothetical protein JW862_06970 [Anaerolineales bacterium]|nr:hypothetical protein [Anaerolineales bacterium]